MKLLLMLTAVLCLSASTKTSNVPIANLDVKKFAGKWYSLYSTPTKYDKGSRQTVTTYTLTADDYYKVKTEYKKGNTNETHFYNSKLFLNENPKKGALEAQFIWPFKADYWVIEVGRNYEYAVVGHPNYDYLFILSRTAKMYAGLYKEIVARCKEKGYPVQNLTSQKH
jgi:apolipoprotein D and lipocalin family protein